LSSWRHAAVAGYNFIRPNRDQLFLLPPALQDWLPPDDLVYFLLDAVDQFDLTPFYAAYRADGVGQAAFQPHMMVALLLYAYCQGVRSSRQIERLCERDVAFRIVAGNLGPDHATIARFRQRHTQALAGLFTDILRLCKEAGLVKVGVVALDGTKMAADAALEANRTYESIRTEVETMLREAETKDVEEDRLYGPEHRGDELPAALRDRGGRLERLRQCRERLEQEAAVAAAEHAQKLETRAAKETETGQKLRGRKPKPVSEAPEAEAKANVTDPDSRILKTRRGYVQGYNAQAVATADQIIVAAEVTTDENDVGQLHPMLTATAHELKAAGVEEAVRAALVDAGYCSEENLAAADPEGPELFMATRKDWKQRKQMRQAPPPRGRIPGHLSHRERMDRKLLTKRGRRLYKQRSQIIEPVFGQTKTCRGIDRFQRRGLANCQSEWKVVCGTHNLLKLWRSGQAGWN
jgi:transposase